MQRELNTYQIQRTGVCASEATPGSPCIVSFKQHRSPLCLHTNSENAISQIDGVSYSHLVTSQCVTRGRFLKLLHGLAAIHTARKPSSAAAPGVMKTTQGLRESDECEGLSAI